MAAHNANFEIINFSGSENLTNEGYDGLNKSCVHQVYCIASGTIDITAKGGGNASIPMTAGQKVDVIVGSYNVQSGSFIGFKSQNTRR